MRRTILVIATVAVTAGLRPPLASGDWPRFRGPNGQGVADADAPTAWTAADQKWTVKLPGRGNGSPVVVGGKLFIQSAAADGSDRTISCLDAATGKTLWEKRTPGHTAKVHQKSSLASCTPAVDGDKVFACTWDGSGVTLTARAVADGAELWSASLGSFTSQHGAGMSPVAHAGKVFVNFDQDGSAEVVAFDAATGMKAWTAPRKAYRACYSTPVIRTRKDGKAELIVHSTAGLTGYDPDTGKPNWEWVTQWKKGEQALRSVASPALVNGLVVGVNGDGSGDRYSAAVDPDAAGGPKVLWEKRSKALTPYVPCPVALDGRVYWLTDQGVAECLEAKTGKVVWSERAFNKGVSASPILVGKVLLGIDEAGKAVAWKADPAGFEKAGDSAVGEAVFATPAAAGGRLYVRGAETLICVGK